MMNKKVHKSSSHPAVWKTLQKEWVQCIIYTFFSYQYYKLTAFIMWTEFNDENRHMLGNNRKSRSY